MKTYTCTIVGMHCPACEKLIKMNLDDVDGVSHVELNPDTGATEISYDESVCGIEDLVQAIHDSGKYEVKE